VRPGGRKTFLGRSRSKEFESGRRLEGAMLRYDGSLLLQPAQQQTVTVVGFGEVHRHRSSGSTDRLRALACVCLKALQHTAFACQRAFSPPNSQSWKKTMS